MSELAQRLNYLRKKSEIKSNETSLLDLATDISLGFIGAASEQKKIDAANERVKNQQDFQLRSSEINRIQQVHPDMSSFDYGDPYRNEDDFERFRAEATRRNNMIVKGSKFSPVGGTISEEAQKDMFTYGGQTIDVSQGMLTQEDIYDYDAWLLGESAAGPARDIATRNNWKGLLSNYDEYSGGYVIDEADYIDIKEKGLIDHLNPMPYDDTTYVVSEEEKTQIVKNYEFWKAGFVGSRELKSRSDITSLTMELNAANAQKLSNLLKQEPYKSSQEALNIWQPDGGGFGLEETTGPNRGKIKGVLVNPETNKTEYDLILTKEKFQQRYPKAYNFLYGNLTFESALEAYASDPELQEELKLIPDVNTRFLDQVRAYNQIETAKRQQGITPSQDIYLDDVRMSDARNMILDDLQEITIGGVRGAIFDDAVINNLSDDQINYLLDQLEQLESSYYSENSLNYNPDVFRFLENYGLNQNQLKGEAIQNLIDELGGR
jgi:hypothetical protein